MSYNFYKVIHFIGLASLLMGLGLGIAYFLLAKGRDFRQVRIWVFSLHGFGLAALLVSGFGLLARLGMISSLPPWVYGKLCVWALLALIISVIKRKPQWFPLTPLLIILLVGIAASLAVTKSF